MDTALPTSIARVIESAEELATEPQQQWKDLCFKFLAWERESVLNRDSVPQDQQIAHKKALLYLLKVTEFMSGLDGDNTDLENLRWRLSESWELIYNQPAPAESQKRGNSLVAAFER